MHDDSDDDTETVRCTICHEEDDCPHLLAWFDDSNADCAHGYAAQHIGAFSSVLKQAFWPLLCAPGSAAVTWADEDLQQAWDWARENLDGVTSADELSLDHYALNRLVKQAFEASGAEEFPGSYPELGGGPGMDVAYSVYFAADPRETFDDALATFTGDVTRATPRPARQRAKTPRPRTTPRRAKSPRGPAKTRRRRAKK